jgi:hypothetical protein
VRSKQRTQVAHQRTSAHPPEGAERAKYEKEEEEVQKHGKTNQSLNKQSLAFGRCRLSANELSFRRKFRFIKNAVISHIFLSPASHWLPEVYQQTFLLLVCHQSWRLNGWTDGPRSGDGAAGVPVRKWKAAKMERGEVFCSSVHQPMHG